MSSGGAGVRQGTATEPLLPSSIPTDSHSVEGLEQPAAVTMVRNENLSRRALPVQASALLFVAVVWSTILSTMSITRLALFGYHPLIQSIGILLLLQAIVVLQRTSTHAPAEKKAAFNAHQTINLLLVLPLFTVGASIMYYLHDQPGASHWISYHGILGSLCVVVAWIQAALGAASVWWKGKLVGGENKGKALWKWHRLSGYVLVALFLTTAVLGVVETTWGKKNSSFFQKILVVAALGLAACAVLIRVQSSKLPKLA
ncbi:related to Cytochrome b561 [Melanopsichium pennsylvanicum]|uniref:Related to Cytochrome b561 n=2 Tax=Melanopsichium pennsylvanicum TaxID=63383 RepID=A0AAJ5C5N3_9BASI|nr:related to Cytochrome b561 [Melanopsichium pennsylvanicum 4]SNX84915.1 related to Cytochrome b561 [Melanopsichium pennsylvanicum]